MAEYLRTTHESLPSALRWLVDNLKANHGYYLLGELFVDADKVINVSQIETYHPVIWGGNTVKLHYAKAEDLREYLNLTAIRGEVVQFWLRPGDRTVELSFSGQGKTDFVPGILSDLLSIRTSKDVKPWKYLSHLVKQFI